MTKMFYPRGRLAAVNATTGSATYGTHMVERDKFLCDAAEIGYRVEAVDSRYFKALNAKNQVEGEWDSRNGGMLAWSK